MRGYGQFCPVAKACEIFGERWTPLILRELIFGSIGFNDQSWQEAAPREVSSGELNAVS